MNLDFRRPSEELCKVVNLVQAALFTLDENGRVAGWSGGAERVTGYSADEVVGELSPLLDSGQPALSLAALWSRLVAGDEFAEGRLSLRHKDGREIYLLADLRRLETEGALSGAAGVMTDLSLHVQINRRHSVVTPPERGRRAFQRMVGESPAMQEVFERIEQAAGVDVTVLIRGETGTGKELAAQAIHALSKRRSKPLVCVNCSAIPDPLLESELFGHAKGSFTGAVREKRGVFESAQGGVLFLDEIGDLGPAVQVKLLRALQEREIRRVGGDQTIKVDVRVVSATHRNLAAMVAAGQFREDLYYRLRVFELLMPPLRERAGDVRTLIGHFVETFSAQHGKAVTGLHPEAMARAESYRWPGNVRELRNAIEHGFVTVRGDQILLKDLPLEFQPTEAVISQFANKSSAPPARIQDSQAVKSLEGKAKQDRERIVAALHEAGGKKVVAASLLGMSRVTLWKKMKKYGISPVYGHGALPEGQSS
jgi:PAS domain S-box-containing protein